MLYRGFFVFCCSPEVDIEDPDQNSSMENGDNGHDDHNDHNEESNAFLAPEIDRPIKRSRSYLSVESSPEDFAANEERQYPREQPMTTVHPNDQWSNTSDNLDLYFQSVCATVKGFPQRKMVEAKMKISQLVGELELQIIDEQARHG